ncbi:MAG TPA: acyltransferase [Thiotrichales bacterium]|nr:acyltransferase [Thiotrichales bacterium]
MRLNKIGRRFLIPSFVKTLLYGLRFRCFVSPRAEMDYSPRVTIGRGSNISAFCKIKATGGPLKLGARVSIGAGCFISCDGEGVEIGDFSMIGANSAIMDSNYRYTRLDVPIREQGITSRGVKIGSNVWIGVGCVILDGSEIGDGVIVAPNSVVSGRVRDNAIVQGNPASVVFVRR